MTQTIDMKIIGQEKIIITLEEMDLNNQDLITEEVKVEKIGMTEVDEINYIQIM